MKLKNGLHNFVSALRGYLWASELVSPSMEKRPKNVMSPYLLSNSRNLNQTWSPELLSRHSWSQLIIYNYQRWSRDESNMKSRLWNNAWKKDQSIWRNLGAIHQLYLLNRSWLGKRLWWVTVCQPRSHGGPRVIIQKHINTLFLRFTKLCTVFTILMVQ